MVKILNRKLAAIALNELGKTGGHKLLEIGPGNGEFLKHLTTVDIKYTCIEPNKSMADACKIIKPDITVIQSTIPPLAVESNSFDLIYMSHVIEHFKDHSEVINVLFEINRSLKKNGIFILFFPDYLSLRQDFFDIDYSHSYVTTLSRIRYLLADSGFKINRIQNYYACFAGFSAFVLQPFFWSVKLLFSFLYGIQNKELFLKGKITFGRNILIVAEKFQ